MSLYLIFLGACISYAGETRNCSFFSANVGYCHKACRLPSCYSCQICEERKFEKWYRTNLYRRDSFVGNFRRLDRVFSNNRTARFHLTVRKRSKVLAESPRSRKAIVGILLLDRLLVDFRHALTHALMSGYRAGTLH